MKFPHLIVIVIVLINCSVALAREQYTLQTVPTETSKEMKYFRYLTVDNGFSRNSVFKVIQDDRGFMWFGLWDGLYRYDGTKLKQVVSTFSKDSNVDFTVKSIVYEGMHNQIWMGTTSGVYIWDAAKQEKSALNLLTTSGDSISGGVGSLCKDQHGNIWMVNKLKELLIYSPKENKLKRLPSFFDRKSIFLTHIFIDENNHIWLCTNNNGVFRVAGNLPDAADAFWNEKWQLKQEKWLEYFSSSYIESVYLDAQHHFWVGTDEGIYRIIPDTAQTQIVRYENNPKEAKHVKTNTFTEYGNYVLAATNKGLFTYDKRTGKAIWNLPDYTREHHLNDMSLTDISIDNEGGVWITSHYGGVNYLHPNNANFSKYIDLNKEIQGHVISGITEDKNHNIWMGVEDNGVCLWNRKLQTIQNFNSSADSKYVPSFSNVQSIYADSNCVYVGMFKGGMDIVNLKDFSHQNFNSANTSPHKLPNFIYSFYKWDDTTMLVGGIDGLYKFNTRTHQVYKINDIQGKVNCIVRDGAGDLWVSTLFKGFYWHSQADNQWHHFMRNQNDSTSLTGNSTTNILPMNQSIYIGTQGNGLWIFDKNQETFEQVAAQSLKDAIIFKILQKGEDLWITTNKGLFSYNIVNHNTKRFTVRDGLNSNQFKENSGIITSDGLFIIGGLNGFNCFRPNELKRNTTAPQVILTDFYLFNKSADIHDEDCPLKRSITYTDHIDLNQKHHSFAFKFSSSCYNDDSKNKYEYKLEPFEKEWQSTHGQSNIASYTNLPAGDYTFYVRTSNGEGVWSEEKCVKMTIHPYWWWSWPMQTLYGLIALSVIANFIIRYRNKKKEEMRMFSIEKEKEVYESKMRFFTLMVHEIRTPLTLILGPLNSAMNKPEHRVKDVLPDLQIIERNGRRLLSLVNQLMDFRKVEEKSYSVQINPLNLKELILQTARDFRYYNIQKHVQFEFDMPEEECWAPLDREAFTKVLLNLLSNAMKFTNDWIKISLLRTHDNKYWEVSVRDNGKGIAATDQPAIFESFYQVHQDLPGDYTGTGIGLFVVKQLMKLQKGDIRVESEIGKGANFITRIPFTAAPKCGEQKVEKKRTSNEVHEDSKVAEPTAKKKRLLIAEDNKEMRNYIASLFTGKYEVDSFENGKLALEATSNQSYDLVITDLMMPVMDGMTLCRILKRQAATSHIPIIILTAKDDEASQQEGFESETDMYVTKPFSPEILQSRVKSVLSNRERLLRKFYTEPEATNEILCTNSPDREFLERMDELLLHKLADCNLPVDGLAAEMAMGRSAFYQKVKGVTGLTPNDYIRTFRLKRAVTLFQKGETRINEVCYRVGFSSPSYFTKRFTQQFGISPSDYLKSIGLKKE